MALEVQQWEEWRPPGPGPMQVLGVLPAAAYPQLSEQGWAWDNDEEEYEGLGDTMVLLLQRDGASRFMLEVAPAHPKLGVQVLGPPGEPREDLVNELLVELALPEVRVARESDWPRL